MRNFLPTGLGPLFSRFSLVGCEPSATAENLTVDASLEFVNRFTDAMEIGHLETMLKTATRLLSELLSEQSLLLQARLEFETIIICSSFHDSAEQTRKLPGSGANETSDKPERIRIINLDQTEASQTMAETTFYTLARHRYQDGELSLYSDKRLSVNQDRLLDFCLQFLGKRLLEAKDWQRLETDSRRDALTGLHNRRYFDELIDKEQERAQRYRHSTALAMMDLDHFKQINDRYGHPAGDQVLRATGRILTETLRKCDTACRYGGEEFALILPETSLAEAQLICERVRKRLENTTITTSDNQKINITASFGVTDSQGNCSLDLIEAADRALYQAKKEGRNRIATYPPTAFQSAI
ncbi:MAG: GGDEF domain-containing protein [Deltaproteobacteria bacterium]|nr:GGDEF domain-containing protein [Deltaproteobacteria bacterium]